MILRIDHIGIAVRHIEERLRLWRDALGLPLAGTETVDSEKVRAAFLAVGESRIELIEPTDDESPIARFLSKRGEGLNHLTLEVDLIEPVLDRLHASSVEILGEAPRRGAGDSRVAFLHPRSCGGVLIELVERAKDRTQSTDLREGEVVLAYLREPQEKLWGVLRRLEDTGIVLEGIDLGSFDDWVAQIDRDEESVVGPSVLFVPMHRVEKLLLDLPSGRLPSLAERFRTRTGRTVHEVLARTRGQGAR